MLKTLARGILALEPFLIVASVFWFWMIDPNRIFGLLMFIPPMIARLILYRRLWKPTPLDPFFVIFLALCVISVYTAPYTRGNITLGGELFQASVPYNNILPFRPLMGMLLVISMADAAWRRQNLNVLIWISIALGLLIGILGLSASQWTTKSTLFLPFLDLLPRITQFPGANGGFNVNEIGGAMAWLTPLMATIAIMAWRNADPTRWGWIQRISATTAFILLISALFFGQSRFALIGVILALAIIIYFLMPKGNPRRWAYIALAIFTIVELLIFAKILDTESTASSLAQRDEDSVTSRLLIWGSGLAMIEDYPLTGVGMNMFRDNPLREAYPVEGYLVGERILPHAHNELIQVGADLGLPGLFVFIAWHAVLLWMFFKVLRSQRENWIALAWVVGVTTALLSHAVFGMGDAITLWDRFTFLFWWVMGLGAATYVVYQHPTPSPKTQ